jgi:hypothetical protein
VDDRHPVGADPQPTCSRPWRPPGATPKLRAAAPPAESGRR